MAPQNSTPASHDLQNFVITIRSPQTYADLGLHVAKVVLICLAAILLSSLGRAIVSRVMHPLIETETRRHRLSDAARRRTLAGLLRSLVTYGVWFFAFIAVIATWDIRAVGLMGAALGTAGVLGVVVGFGAQKLVRDVFTGIFILFEDQYSVGDTVTIGTVTGVVEDVGIRVTRIRDEIGRLILLPNGDISQVTNHSRGRLDAMVEINVAMDQDLDAVGEVVTRASEKAIEPAGTPLAAPATIEGITAMDGAKITLRIAAPAAPGRQQAAEMALRAALREELLAAGVKLV